LIPDTYLALGEWYFEKSQVNDAIESYKKVLDFKEHHAYPYAVYKLGWSYFNAAGTSEKTMAENFKKSIAAFKLVVKLSDAKGEENRNFDLRDEAISDLIMVWAETEEIDAAWRYFRTIGEKESFYKMLERLGRIYQEQGKNTQAIAVFQRLIRESPLRPKNPEVHAKLLELYDIINNIPAVVAEIKKMHKLYIAKDSAWIFAQGQNKEAIETANHIVEINTHRYGAIFHQRGQKSKSVAYMRYAADVYEAYLGSFPKNGNAYEIRYYLAEILYDFKKYENSSFHYLKVAKDNPGGKYLKPAAINAVGAMNELVSSKTWPKLPPLGQVPTPITLPKEKAKLIETVDQYIALLPKEKEGEPMRFTAAQILFEHGHYKESIKRFETITKVIPETKQAKASVKVILGYFSEKENWPEVVNWSRRFVKNSQLMDQELKVLIVDTLRGALFKQALALEKSKNFDKAADTFIAYQKEFPTDKNADRAVYNAMLNYFKVEKIDSALAAGNLILSQYPRSTVVPDTMVSVASTYETLARFNDAASLYQRLASTYPKDQRSSMALFNASVLYKGLKRPQDSIQALYQFVQTYPHHQLASDARLELANILEINQRYKEAVQQYTIFSQYGEKDRETSLSARAKAAVLNFRYVNKAEGLRQIETLKSELLAKNAPVAVDARATVAGVLFAENEALIQDFMRFKISDGNQLEKLLTEKQRRLDSLVNRYETIFSLGNGEFTVASLYRLGEAHEDFAQTLFKSPVPKGISKAEADALKTELEKIAFKLKAESHKLFETAFKRSREVETFTVWTKKTYQKMVELNPQKNTEIDEISADPNYMTHKFEVNTNIAALIKD
jgi:TolA-binding protein